MSAQEARRLIIWRHGETDHNAKGVYQGQRDTELSVRGVAEAAAAAVVLARYAPQRIVSSDLVRAASTATALSGLVDCEVEHDPRLREIDVADWAGLTHAEVAQRYPVETAAIAAGQDARRGGSGEDMTDVARRTRTAADEVWQALSPGRTAVLVTHGLAARALVSDLLKWQPMHMWLTVGSLCNCHWAEVCGSDGGFQLVSWNQGAQPGPR